MSYRQTQVKHVGLARSVLFLFLSKALYYFLWDLILNLSLMYFIFLPFLTSFCFTVFFFFFFLS